MWNNIGTRMKSLAQIVCWIGIVLAAIGCLAYWFGGKGFFQGLLVLIVGGLSAWIGSWALYGFGIIVNHYEELEEKKNEPEE